MSREKGLPSNPDAEQWVIGSVLLEPEVMHQARPELEPGDFSIENNRRVWRRMCELYDAGEKAELHTVFLELQKHEEHEGMLTYLTSLTDGLPVSPNLQRYIREVKEHALLRAVIFASDHMSKRAMEGGSSAAEVLAGMESTLLELNRGMARSRPMTAAQILDAAEGGVTSFIEPGRRDPGLSTGFHRLDRMTYGLRAGDLFILAGRPSMGKTAMALNIAEHVALRLKRTVAVFSLEMSKESLIQRMLCSVARVDRARLYAGNLSPRERELVNAALDAIYESPLIIDDSPGVTVADFRAKVANLKLQYPSLSLVIVDYLQLMSSRGKSENRNQEVSAQSRGMKLAAKEFGIPLILLSQLSRAVETRRGDHRPQLSDLRESGSIEQDADLVGFVFREEIYDKDREDLKGLAELILAKQRNGPIGTAKMVFLEQYARFESLAEDLEGEFAH